jgi:hypothetical protein
MSTPESWARYYAAKGWIPVSLERGKETRVPGWPERAKSLDFGAFREGCNVGVLLGECSGWLVDVDLDVPEAVPFADEFLPPTLTFGKASTPTVHRLYVAVGATHETWKGQDGKMLVELRSGPKAHQTMFPGSTHPNGEPVSFVSFREPAVIDAAELRRLAALVAAGALLVRSWPQKGRHESQLALMGALLR